MSHKLLSSVLERVPAEKLKGKKMIEVGSTREMARDSTGHLFGFCKEREIDFITVDMNPEQISRLQERFPDLNATTAKGEEFLEQFDGEINFCYLDAFDYQHGRHSQSRISAYKKYLNTQISNEACHQMHLRCAKALEERMPVGSIIVFDDVFGAYSDIEWDGKGKLAIPFLLENGFVPLTYTEEYYSKKTDAGGVALIRKER